MRDTRELEAKTRLPHRLDGNWTPTETSSGRIDNLQIRAVVLGNLDGFANGLDRASLRCENVLTFALVAPHQ